MDVDRRRRGPLAGRRAMARRVDIVDLGARIRMTSGQAARRSARSCTPCSHRRRSMRRRSRCRGVARSRRACSACRRRRRSPPRRPRCERVLGHDLFARARAAAARGALPARNAGHAARSPDGTLIEGVVDLAFEENGAWTVVDYKTDRELAALAKSATAARSRSTPIARSRRRRALPRPERSSLDCRILEAH